jgi:hypothetical protein
VVRIENGEDSTAVITGFTIQNGNTGLGGGIYCDSTQPIIEYNIIRSNYADAWYAGGGIMCFYAEAKIRGNVIEGNSAGGRGAGICAYLCSPEISYNLIINNNSGAYPGGGIYGHGSSSDIINNTIIRNSSGNGKLLRRAGWLYRHRQYRLRPHVLRYD